MGNKTRYKVLQYGIYPVTMLLSVVLFFALQAVDEKYLAATTVPVLFAILIIIISEKYLPFKKEWKPTTKDFKNDGLYLLLIQTLLPKIFVWLLALFTLRFLKRNDLIIFDIWPSHLPLGIQALMVVLISDFARYWLHRLNHTIPVLWRLHAVHHSVDKMYWMNTSRFHPLEKALQFLMDVLPFMLLGVPEEVLALHLVLYGVNGFFQHCNIDLKFGWLNYIVSSTELHRWHHSRLPEESNNNYGNNVIVWDLLFGSYFIPEERKVEELGLINKNYPSDFTGQMKAPLRNNYDKIDSPEISLSALLLNWLMKVKIAIIKRTSYKDFYEGTKRCGVEQNQVLLSIVNSNKNSIFGENHSFDTIATYQDFKKLVPVNTYEDLKPYIVEQAKNKNTKSIISDEIIMFNKTSGTTSEPKLIPVTRQTLKGLKKSQQISMYLQYKSQSLGYVGKVMGIVSPAIDSMSEYNIPVGSASGLFYKNMPFFVRSKYVVPHAVFEIDDYELKYYCILLLSLQHTDVTYCGTANPTTFLKLTKILNERKADFLKDLKSGSVSGLAEKSEIREVILKKLKPSKERIAELEKIFESQEKLAFHHLWPHIKLLTTWSGGSCGVALKTVLELMPENTTVIDPGYLSSELRGSITFDAKTQGGLFTFQDNFFEFVERSNWESEKLEFLLLHELEVNKEYYLFVTTSAGLYRYNMNDIIKVSGFVNQCPLVHFIQKGKGVCNITGEKLYESQLLTALNQLGLNYLFVQVLANEETCTYECYIETDKTINSDSVSDQLDALICEQNMEYKEKRASKRLKRIEIKNLKTGAFDLIKQQFILTGKNESQYKTILLQYKKDMGTDLNQYLK